jgi:hypothetical protein
LRYDCYFRFVSSRAEAQVGSVWVNEASQGDGLYLIASGLSGRASQIRVVSVLEPSFIGVRTRPRPDDPMTLLTLYGFVTDGVAKAAGPRRLRRIELVGDSISAGYGARGSAETSGCVV